MTHIYTSVVRHHLNSEHDFFSNDSDFSYKHSQTYFSFFYLSFSFSFLGNELVSDCMKSNVCVFGCPGFVVNDHLNNQDYLTNLVMRISMRPIMT